MTRLWTTCMLSSLTAGFSSYNIQKHLQQLICSSQRSFICSLKKNRGVMCSHLPAFLPNSPSSSACVPVRGRSTISIVTTSDRASSLVHITRPGRQSTSFFSIIIYSCLHTLWQYAMCLCIPWMMTTGNDFLLSLLGKEHYVNLLCLLAATVMINVEYPPSYHEAKHSSAASLRFGKTALATVFACTMKSKSFQ